jgi:hypothetical protein
LLVGILDNHLDPQAAMAAPPLLANFERWKPGDDLMNRAQLVPEGAYDQNFLKELREAGENIEEKSKQDVLVTKGTAVLGTIDLENEARRSVETPGIFAFAAAY